MKGTEKEISIRCLESRKSRLPLTRHRSCSSFVKKDAAARKLAKAVEWQKNWSILYVPWMSIGYYKEERMQGIVPFEE